MTQIKAWGIIKLEKKYDSIFWFNVKENVFCKEIFERRHENTTLNTPHSFAGENI